MRNKLLTIIWAVIIFILSTCSQPRFQQPTETPSFPPTAIETLERFTPLPVDTSGECGFIWANEALPELSDRFEQALQNAIPGAQGRAQAYGENCVSETGEIINFLAMETDFFVTLKVENLDDKQALGILIQTTMEVLAEFPTDETPGPLPGYVGINFETEHDTLRIWVMSTKIEEALDNGLQGEELLNFLRAE